MAGHGTPDLARSSPPHVVFVDPPCLVADRECEVEVRLSHEMWFGIGASAHAVVIRRDDEVVANIALTASTGRAVRALLPQVQSGTLMVVVTGEGGLEQGVPATLMVLPQDVCKDVEEIFVLMTNVVRKESPTTRVSAFDRNELVVQESVWRDYFQPFTKDLGGLLDRLALKVPLDRRSHNLLQSMVVYMLENSAWRLSTFFLRMCIYSGIPIRVGARTVVEEDLEPSALRRLAEQFK